MLSKFWNPKHFLDTVYLSQLTQAICIKNATEGWRINPRSHGALYWQYNDCWGVNSWSGMDYYGNMKALQYCAKRFNQNIILVLQRKDKAMEILCVNDENAPIKIKLKYGVMTYDGEALEDVVNNLEVKENKVSQVAKLNLKTAMKRHSAKRCFVYAIAYDENDNIICQETLPLTNENKAKLPKTQLTYDISLDGNTVKIDINSTKYARFVEIRLKGYSTMLSDNYFDMLPNQTKCVSFELPNGETLESIKEKISMRCLCDIERKHSALRDKIDKSIIFWNPTNLANYIARTFDK